MRWVVLIKYVSQFQSIIDLKGKTFGITRFGGGSHINTVLLAKDQGWLVNQNEERENNIRIKPVGDLNSLANAIRKGIIDCFIWIGEIHPPWPCLMVAATTDFIEMSTNQIKSVLDSIQGAAKIFHAEGDYSLGIMKRIYKISEDACQRFMKSVKYSIDGTISQNSSERHNDYTIKRWSDI
jgi:ABC-type nitrate/sulfonate/bicarbonate transport system substrate-binding protein